MVWAIAIVCVSLSCEPVPVLMGWFYDDVDCRQAVHMIDVSWQPTAGIYQMSCYYRLAI